MSTSDKMQKGSYDGFKKVGARRTSNKSLVENKSKDFRSFKKTKEVKEQKSNIDPSKPFCKVCKDAGKSEEEYTNHFVRASAAHDAEVVCPTLLSQACRYCQKDGHTVRYCPSLSSRFSGDRKYKNSKFVNKKNSIQTKTSENQLSQESQSKKDTQQTQFTSNNPFAALSNDGEESDDEERDSSNDAMKQWEQLHSGKTLNYGDLKVKCVDGKLVFELINKSEEKTVVTSNQDNTSRKQSWAQVASAK